MEETTRRYAHPKDVPVLNDEGDCQMCKYVFAFAFAGVSIVMIFTYFQAPYYSFN